MTARREDAPKLTNVRIPRLGDMFNHCIGQNESELAVCEWKGDCFWSMDEGYLRIEGQFSQQRSPLLDSR